MDCILVFVKFPEAGKVKTRLSKEINEDKAAQLYELFVNDTFVLLDKFNANVRVCFSPKEKEEEITKWLGSQHLEAQEGDSLGERLDNAFVKAFNDGDERVLVIGSDSPDLPKEILETAFKALEHDDMVIGPAEDGGYYLLGFNKDAYTKKAFENISWSTNTVFKETMDKLDTSKVYILPEWRDVDTLEDLKALQERNKKTEFARSLTMKYLKNQKL